MTGARYGHNTPEWKRNGLAYDPALDNATVSDAFKKPGDSSSWKARFDSLVADLKSIGTALQLNRIWSLYSSSQTYEEIVAILQREYDYLVGIEEVKKAHEDTADLWERENQDLITCHSEKLDLSPLERN